MALSWRMPASTNPTSRPSDGVEAALLLPRDPDGSAERCARGLPRASASDSAVIINDSFGRAWRRGTAGVAIGVAGLPALLDLRGDPDLFGRTLEVSIIGFADEIAAAASLLHGPGRRRQPGGAGARPRAGRRRPTGVAALVRAAERGSVPMSRGPRRRAFGRRRRRQARAGLEPRAAAGRAPDRRQHRRRFRASRPQHLARSRHPDVYARRPRQSDKPAGAAATRPGPSWRRSARWAARPGSASATAISRPHVERTRRLRRGETLSAITDDICRRLGIAPRVLPMSDDPRAHARATRDDGWIDFQDYFVRQQCRPVVRELAFDGAARRAPQPDVLAALHERHGCAPW